MHFAVLPPELNSGRMYAGPGVGPMLTAASAWDELANELNSAAEDFESVVSGLTSDPWQGPAAESMAASAAPQTEWLRTTAAQATQAGTQAKAAASAYESAYSMTVPPAEVAANRAQLMTLQATNLLGQNTSAIAANEVEYGEMWAQDVAAMYGYAGSAKTASQVTPFTSPQQATNQGGLASQGTAVTQAAGTTTGNAQSAMSAVPSALQSLESSTGLTGFSDFSNAYDLASLGSSLLGNGTGLIGLSGAAGFITKTEDKITAPLFGPDDPGSAQTDSADAAWVRCSQRRDRGVRGNERIGFARPVVGSAGLDLGCAAAPAHRSGVAHAQRRSRCFRDVQRHAAARAGAADGDARA